ncbi:uncharacterized protein VTP21DRAFT_4206 [Calcarisporiella thermophila]|uniref:uncharacterized protein n=1 Tax=Calcarisporiella thermophila TaxID=911321 RepID=UPI0037439B52
MGGDDSAAADLVQLHNFSSSSGAPTDDQVCSLLQSRLRRDIPYTRVGANTLVVVNPYKPLELMNNAYAQQYAEVFYRNFNENDGEKELPPHIYELATRTYYYMRRTGNDQGVIFSGITGSGKTMSFRHFVKQLLVLASRLNSKEPKSHIRLANAQTVLECFGNSRTALNRTASRFGLYQEIQFNDRGRVMGAKLLTYFLDKSRVTNVPKEEGNFHVFYALMAGATAGERLQWHLPQEANQFTYLAHSATHRPSKQQLAEDALLFDDIRAALRACGLKSKSIAQIFQLLSAVLHLGNLTFYDDSRSQQASQDACRVRNRDVLDLVSNLLGVSASKLETALTLKLQFIHKEMCTAFLNAQAATEQRDVLAQTIYSLLFSWIVESMNAKLCSSAEPSSIVALLDQFGIQQNGSKIGSFEAFCANMAYERVQYYLQQLEFRDTTGAGRDGVSLPRVTVQDNTPLMDLLHLGVGGGLSGVLDRETARMVAGHSEATDANLLVTYQKQFGSHSDFTAKSHSYTFAINHSTGQPATSYTVDGFLNRNLDSIPPDFVNLFRGSTNSLVVGLFSGKVLTTQAHPKDERTIVKAQLSCMPVRAPLRRSEATPPVGNLDGSKRKTETVMQQLHSTLDDLFGALNQMNLWRIYHIRPNDAQLPDQFDMKRVKMQVKALFLPELAVRNRTQFLVGYTYGEFWERYDEVLNVPRRGDERARLGVLARSLGWGETEYSFGRERVWLSDRAWKQIEDKVRASEKGDRPPNKPGERVGKGGEALAAEGEFYQGGYVEEGSYVASEDEFSPMHYRDEYDDGSMYGESEWGGQSFMVDREKNEADAAGGGEQHVEEVPITPARRWWVRFVWFMTWWIPSIFLRWFGRMRREDVQMAWREKVTLCMLIALFSFVIIFYIIPFNELICPNTKTMFSQREVSVHAAEDDFFVSIRGTVYDITRFAHLDHGTLTHPASIGQMKDLAGQDVSELFPVPLIEACPGIVTEANAQLGTNKTFDAGFVHLSGQFQNDPSLGRLRDPNWYLGEFLPKMSVFKRGGVVWLWSKINNETLTNQRIWGVINDVVYDLSQYFSDAQKGDFQPQVPGVASKHWLDPQIEEMFRTFPGTDLTDLWNNRVKLPSDMKKAYIQCFDKVFRAGTVDHRQDFRCQFNVYLLLVISLLLVSVILVKFLAALQFGGKPRPGNHDKFVICQVPCYTEGEESLRKTIDSLTMLEYDDKRKLLFIIADGMIVGSGNERPTPRIVLDILGVDAKIDPEPLMFRSIGEGSRQLNYGKVYSGLYECEGHVVPYIVVVKVGKPSERSRPGNRGKRDSQVILMRFLNKVHFDAEMTPLELEIYHQMKNVIGVNPSFYEFIFMVDADTEVLPDSLSRLISCMSHDARTIGICGETQLANENNSWITMIQVYEYFISHHMAKAFESLFGSVTCLPGCFCMYRVRTSVKNIPLIISSKVINDYSDNHVDTLHKKNLLSLGEDRYLTTLMMKYFPQYKMTFTPHAKCKTTAPDRWNILLSQRRRWINSTIHNLFELIFLPEMCGFCCFSMRFVVFVDLLSTFILPVTVIYLGYLLYILITARDTLPKVAFIMLAAVYGLQAVIFILRRQWQHVGWMVIYLIALPIFAFFIPLYAFWHFDDFSWGNTRVVVGEGKKQIIVEDDEQFDEKMIPMKKWSTYEQELWEGGSMSGRSGSETVSGGSFRGIARSFVESPGSVIGGVGPEPDMDYYRDTHLTRGSGFSWNERDEVDYDGGRRVSRGISQDYGGSGAGWETATNPGRRKHGSSASIHTTSRGARPTSGSSYLQQPQQPRRRDRDEDEEIIAEVRKILADADLMSTTKKQVRESVGARLGLDLSGRKEYINSIIDAVLQGRI